MGLDTKPATPSPPERDAGEPEGKAPAEVAPEGDAETGIIEPEDDKPKDNKPEDDKPEDNKPEHNKPEDNKPEDNKPEGSEIPDNDNPVVPATSPAPTTQPEFPKTELHRRADDGNHTLDSFQDSLLMSLSMGPPRPTPRPDEDASRKRGPKSIDHDMAETPPPASASASATLPSNRPQKRPRLQAASPPANNPRSRSASVLLQTPDPLRVDSGHHYRQHAPQHAAQSQLAVASTAAEATPTPAIASHAVDINTRPAGTHDSWGAFLGAREKDILSSPSRWLNDAIINSVLQMVVCHLGDVQVFNNAYLTAKDLPPQGKNLHALRAPLQARRRHLAAVLVPINIRNSHWACLHVRIAEKKARLLDSMRSETGSDLAASMARTLVNVYLPAPPHSSTSTSTPEDRWSQDGWSFERVDCPQQGNGTDCGVYALAFSIMLALGIPIPDTINAPLWRQLFLSMVLGTAMPQPELDSRFVPPTLQAADDGESGPRLVMAESEAVSGEDNDDNGEEDEEEEDEDDAGSEQSEEGSEGDWEEEDQPRPPAATTLTSLSNMSDIRQAMAHMRAITSHAASTYRARRDRSATAASVLGAVAGRLSAVLASSAALAPRLDAQASTIQAAEEGIAAQTAGLLRELGDDSLLSFDDASDRLKSIAADLALRRHFLSRWSAWIADSRARLAGLRLEAAADAMAALDRGYAGLVDEVESGVWLPPVLGG